VISKEFELLRVHPRQDSLDGPPNLLLSFETEDDRFDFTRHAEESPSRFVDFAIQSIPIENLD
jgi:hypothetical protein